MIIFSSAASVRFKLTLLALLLWTANSFAFEPFVIDQIQVNGLQRITEGTVYNYLPVEVGDRFDAQRAGSSIRALYKTGFFEDISVFHDANTLIFTVKERPAIDTLTLTGNKEIKTEDLEKALAGIGLSEGEIFDRLALDRVEQELRGQYFSRGKYNVQLVTSINNLPRNRVGITITIAEGKAAKIKHLNIVGNTAFSDEELLSGFESATTNWTSWYSSDDQYSRDKVSGDLEKLRSYYQDRGYMDFEIESTQVAISPNKKDIYITANVREGDVYSVEDIELSGDLILDPTAMKQLLVLKAGDTFSRKKLESSIENIKGVLANLGYAFANVTPNPVVDKNDNTVNLTLFVDPSKRVYVNRVIFDGNMRTMDEVLRREIRQMEGGWFSQAAVDRSKIRLQRLGFFKEVNVETPKVPGSEDQVNVIYSVEETTAGSFSFGLGYSQFQGLIFNVSVSQENFLGTGKSLSVGLNNSTVYKRFSVAYNNPYWTDSGISRGFNLSYRKSDTGGTTLSSYTSDVVSAGVQFGLPITETDRINVGLSYEDTVIHSSRGFTSARINDFLCQLNNIPLEPIPGGDNDCVDFSHAAVTGDANINDPDYVANPINLQGQFYTYQGSLSWGRDSRNSFFKPTSGSYQRFGGQIALPGSTIQYYKLFYEARKYFPIHDEFSLMVGGQLGYGDTYGSGDVNIFPFFENFYAGGVRSVRGYQDNTLGPVDELGNPLGGAFRMVGRSELSVPIPFLEDTSTVRIALFTDVGNVFTDYSAFKASELRASAGLTVRWQAPVGPIEISFAKPFNNQDGDRTETLQFSFGNL
ncbi:MAG: outer membrane protein assembly factor BamA [bacterium]